MKLTINRHLLFCFVLIFFICMDLYIIKLKQDKEELKEVEPELQLEIGYSYHSFPNLQQQRYSKIHHSLSSHQTFGTHHKITWRASSKLPNGGEQQPFHKDRERQSSKQAREKEKLKEKALKNLKARDGEIEGKRVWKTCKHESHSFIGLCLKVKKTFHLFQCFLSILRRETVFSWWNPIPR